MQNHQLHFYLLNHYKMVTNHEWGEFTKYLCSVFLWIMPKNGSYIESQNGI